MRVHRQAEGADRRRQAAPEKHRAFWYAWIPTYKNAVFDILAQHGVSVPVCETFLVHWDEIDERDPFEGLALRCLKDPFIGIRAAGPISWTGCERFGIDAAILFATPACRHSKGNWEIMKEAAHARGVPLLVLDMDIADPRAYARSRHARGWKDSSRCWKDREILSLIGGGEYE